MHCGTHPEPVKGLSAESKISCRWLRANSTRPSKDSLSAPLPYKLATCSAQTQAVSEKQCQRQCMIKGSAQASQASYSSMAAEACQDVDQHGLLLGRKRLTTCRAWSLVMHWYESTGASSSTEASAKGVAAASCCPLAPVDCRLPSCTNMKPKLQSRHLGRELTWTARSTVMSICDMVQNRNW